jgi:glycosyltransferase involved in cell wall biosynthesis
MNTELWKMCQHLISRVGSKGYVRVLSIFDFHSTPIWLMALGTVILLSYYLVYFLSLLKHRDADRLTKGTSVSIIISAHNEEANLRKNLPYFLNQDHESYEVVVINDGSWDDTPYLVRDFQKSYSNLKLVDIDKDMKRTAGKKMALTLGIKAATHDRLVFSDADCFPVDRGWLRRMDMALTNDFVLGYGRYEKRPGFLNRIIRYDTFHAACLYFSKAYKGKAYMGVGRNLAYTRSIYDDSGGFKGHYHIAAGDDDLFVNHNARKGSASIVMDEKSHTISIPKRKFPDWFKQKRRHISVSGAYSKESKRFLGIYHLGQLLFYTGLTLGLIWGSSWQIMLSFFLAKTLIQLLISNNIAGRLREKDLLVLLPILEPVSLVLNIAVAISVKTFKPRKWK